MSKVERVLHSSSLNQTSTINDPLHVAVKLPVFMAVAKAVGCVLPSMLSQLGKCNPFTLWTRCMVVLLQQDVHCTRQCGTTGVHSIKSALDGHCDISFIHLFIHLS